MKKIRKDELVDGRFYWIREPGRPWIIVVSCFQEGETTIEGRPLRKTLRGLGYVVDVDVFLEIRKGEIFGPIPNPDDEKLDPVSADVDEFFDPLEPDFDRCAHDEIPGECDACDRLSDFEFDRAREDRVFGRGRF